ncbi:hypothetical protein Tco_0273904 [Tanacetum coccineum]
MIYITLNIYSKISFEERALYYRAEIVPAFLKELIYKVLELQVFLLELNRFEVHLTNWRKARVHFLHMGQFPVYPLFLVGVAAYPEVLSSVLLWWCLLSRLLVLVVTCALFPSPFALWANVNASLEFKSGHKVANPESSHIFLRSCDIPFSQSDGKIRLPSSGPQFEDSWEKEFHQDRASSVKVPVANFTLQSLVQLLWENTDSVLSNQQMRQCAFLPLKLIVFAMLAAYASRAA